MQLKTECGSQFTNKLEGMFKVCILVDQEYFFGLEMLIYQYAYLFIILFISNCGLFPIPPPPPFSPLAPAIMGRGWFCYVTKALLKKLVFILSLEIVMIFQMMPTRHVDAMNGMAVFVLSPSLQYKSL